MMYICFINHLYYDSYYNWRYYKIKENDFQKWIDDLKELFQNFGKSPNDWEIYRGDEFQIEVKNPEEALQVAVLIKAF